MRKLSLTLYLMLGYLSAFAQRDYTGYGRGIDRYDGRGFFLVTGNDAISGIFMIAICAVIAFICYKVAGTFDKNKESTGIKNTLTTILYIIASVAMIAAIGFAFALWWVVLIIAIIIAIYGGIREKIEGKKQQIVNPKKNQETPEDTPKTKHSTISNEWSLISFVREHGGKLQVGDFKNSSNGETFKACIVSNNGENKIFINFHSRLGELTPQEIKEKKHYLFVGQTESGNYFLYTKK